MCVFVCSAFSGQPDYLFKTNPPPPEGPLWASSFLGSQDAEGQTLITPPLPSALSHPLPGASALGSSALLGRWFPEDSR